MSLSIVIPTLGRPTLARTVFSFIEQLEDGDEVIFVADPKGDVDYVKWMRATSSNRVGVDWRHVVHSGPGGWGLPQRNRGYELATRPYVWCLADDDIATPGALDAIREAVAASAQKRRGVAVTAQLIRAPAPWFIFRAGRSTEDPWLWTNEELRMGNLDADCIVAPSGAAARWGIGYTGDYDFAAELRAELGEPAWCSSVIAVTKPSPEYLASHYSALALSDSLPWTATAPA